MQRIGLLFLGATLLGSPVTASAEKMSDSWGLSSFTAICVDGFGDAAKVAAAAEAAGLTREVPGTQPVTGTGWHSARASASYADAAWLPRDLPSPQCSFKFTGEAGHDHAALAAALERQLSLPAGKTRGKAPRLQTQWDYTAGTAKRRLFLSSAPTADGTAVSLSLLNLRR